MFTELINNFSNSSAISKNDFVLYYTDVSMTIIHDNQFVHLLETTWGVSEDEEQSVFKEQVEALAAAIRIKLRVIGNQSLEEFILRNIFKEFDSNKNGSLSIEEISAKL